MLATLSNADVHTLFVVLALVAFAAAVYLAFLRNAAGALLCAFIGILILLFAT